MIKKPFQKKGIEGDIFYSISSLILILLILCGEHLFLLVYCVAIVDFIWIGIIIAAALSSHEGALRKSIFPMPNRLIGVIFFVCCFCFECSTFSKAYFNLREDFKSSSFDFKTSTLKENTLTEKEDAFYLSLGTMTTIDIVDYSAETPGAKKLRSFQIISNLLMFFTVFPILLSRLSSFKDRDRPGQEQPMKSMIKEYQASLEDTNFVTTNIEELTGLSPDQWCACTGLFDLEHQFVNKSDLKIEGKYPNLTVKITKENLILEMSFRLNVKTITIDSFSLPDADIQFSSEIHKSILKHAKENGFGTIELKTSTPIDNLKLNFLDWEKFGYKPTREYETRFKEKFGNYQPIYKFLRDTTKLSEWNGEEITWHVSYTLPK